MHAGHACLAGTILLGVCGQMLFRAATAHGGGLQALISWQAAAGCALYAASTVLYLLALQRMPISVAMPTLACGYIIVAVLGWVWWREPFVPMHLAGLLLIVGGVTLLHLPVARPS